jgi:hypothetical protein
MHASNLKGSTVGRIYPEERARENPRAVLKDLNWIERGKELAFGPEKRALLTEQLRRDAEFLKELQVMDYSLLVGIHNTTRHDENTEEKKTSNSIAVLYCINIPFVQTRAGFHTRTTRGNPYPKPAKTLPFTAGTGFQAHGHVGLKLPGKKR